MSDKAVLKKIGCKLSERGCTVIRPSRGAFQADVVRINTEESAWVVKDFAARSWLARKFVCRFLIRREISLLSILADTGLVPKCLGVVAKDALVMEYLEGVSPRKRSGEELANAYLVTASFLQTLHTRGYAHNDFRRSNILIQPDGGVRFIDFASCLSRCERYHWLTFGWNRLINFMQRADNASLIKMKKDFTDQPLTADEQKKMRKSTVVRALKVVWKKGINEPILRRLK
jgi:RIO-like serine/threonine protein kinase